MKIVPKNKTQDVIMSVVDTLCELVKPTYGPSENKVIIGKGFGASALDDGVQIAKDLELEDEAENYVLKLIREVAVKTNERVGDGTTSSLIILQAILKEAKTSGLDSGQVVIELKKGMEEAVAQLKAQSRPIKTQEDLEKVALVSFNNPEIAKLLAELIFKVGENGLIDVQSSQGAVIESEIVGGFQIESGLISPHLANENEKCVIEDALILVTDKSFHTATEIVPVMEKVLASGKSNLVIFCKDFTGEALTVSIINKIKGSFRLCAVRVGDVDASDIALLTGSNLVLLESKIELTDFGYAKKVVSKLENTVIVDGGGKKEEVDQAVEELKKDKENERRVARLTNSVAVIKVGAKTGSEAKALLFKVEDASNAVKVAFKGGVVKGGGETLCSLKTSSEILNSALKYPKKQLDENIWGKLEITDDIIDPTEVLIAGIECAVSIACLLISVKGIIYDTKTK